MTKNQGWIIIAELAVLLFALWEGYNKAQIAAAQFQNSPVGQVTTGLSTLFSNM